MWTLILAGLSPTGVRQTMVPVITRSKRTSAGRGDMPKTGSSPMTRRGFVGALGARLEDVVLVTRKGCKNLSKFPKVLEI